jgi:hypothetical protein
MGHLAANVLLACRCKKLPIATSISTLAYCSKSGLVLFHNLKSMIIQYSMVCNRRFALIHIRQDYININTWIINII